MERFRPGMACLLLLLLCLLCQSLDLCASLNDEGRALLRFRGRVAVDPYGALSNWNRCEDDPCSWFGVECSDDGRVVALNLKDLLLEGTLAPELGKLVHLKSLILHNNSFCGSVPKEISELQKLEILDLGHNNLTGPFPSDISSILSLEILVIRSNMYIGNIPSELHDPSKISEHLVDMEQSSSRRVAVTRNSENATIRRLLQVGSNGRGSHHRHHDHNSEAPASAPFPAPLPSPYPSPMTALPPFKSNSLSSPSASPLPKSSPTSQTPSATKVASPGNVHDSAVPPFLVTPASKRNTHLIVYLSVGAGISCLAALSILYFLCCRVNKVGTVIPWRTGLSGQLQKAFVTGIPSLKRAELETACEDFSNVVGSLSDCFLYKGTLSSGIEIAVTSTMVTNAKDWSEQYEDHFRKKISVLSKVNHKNFMNLIGYSEEEEPFTRMMVYEYASNGTLFEHLHVKEADHLDWSARLRIVMGIAYCLDYMHQLEPPVVVKNLNSSSIYLCEDNAAKISDIPFWNEKEADSSFERSGVMDSQLSTRECNVYKFGIILLEIISGRLPFSEDDGLLVLWASSHLTGKRPLMDMVDVTLESVNEEEVVALCEVVKCCINPDPKRRLAMAEVVARLRQITSMSPDAASPKLSPLWWAELEIISTESNSLQ